MKNPWPRRSREIWKLGNHRVLCGDGTNPQHLGEVLENRPCDLVFTDLPYNVDYQGKTSSRMKIANDNLGAEFGTFLPDACSAMLRVSGGALYMCMSSGWQTCQIPIVGGNCVNVGTRQASSGIAMHWNDGQAVHLSVAGKRRCDRSPRAHDRQMLVVEFLSGAV